MGANYERRRLKAKARENLSWGHAAPWHLEFFARAERNGYVSNANLNKIANTLAKIYNTTVKNAKHAIISNLYNSLSNNTIMKMMNIKRGGPKGIRFRLRHGI
jgi:hypothetical protein